MKRKTAREILAESFRELAQSKPVDKITVPNIIENCGYSKTTFYRLFKDKYDLMAWDYAQRLQAIVGQTEKEDYEWKQILWDVAFCMHLSDHLYCCIKNQYTYGKLHKPGVKRMTLGLFHFCPKSAIIQSAKGRQLMMTMWYSPSRTGRKSRYRE